MTNTEYPDNIFYRFIIVSNEKETAIYNPVLHVKPKLGQFVSLYIAPVYSAV